MLVLFTNNTVKNENSINDEEEVTYESKEEK